MPSQQGPQFIDSVKTDAQGKFEITKPIPPGGAGPLLLQAVYGGVQYNQMLPPRERHHRRPDPLSLNPPRNRATLKWISA